MPTGITSRHRKEVFTGRYIDYDDPRPEQISLEDVAHGLSMLCRYGGHTPFFYSVAEHAVLVAGLLAEDGWTPPLILAGLHHDDHEAYLGDLPTPLKNVLGDRYEILRDRFDVAISEALGWSLSLADHSAVHQADNIALRMETHLMMPSRGSSIEWQPAWRKWGTWVADVPRIGKWSPGMDSEDAKQAYLDIHKRLIAEC